MGKFFISNVHNLFLECKQGIIIYYGLMFPEVWILRIENRSAMYYIHILDQSNQNTCRMNCLSKRKLCYSYYK